jgi:hypothetical protein
MKGLLPVIIFSVLSACNNTGSKEDLKDSIEVIRAADSMLKLDAARDTFDKD